MRDQVKLHLLKIILFTNVTFHLKNIYSNESFLFLLFFSNFVIVAMVILNVVKDQRFCSHAVFKLTQINCKYHCLEHAKVCKRTLQRKQ